MRLANMGTLLRAAGRQAGSLLVRSALPETCAGCGLVGSWFCPACRDLLFDDDPPGCQRCGRRGERRPNCARCGPLFPEQFIRLRAGYAFDGPMRRAVHRFKYSREHERGRQLGMMLARRFEALFPATRLDAIVPVPLHPRRYRERGFNQSAILAQQLSLVCDAPVVSAVRRARHTPPQVSLRSQERFTNLAGAFVLNDEHDELLRGKRVLIVDDVTTTGATISAVAETLQSAGAERILAVTLAREQ